MRWIYLLFLSGTLLPHGRAAMPALLAQAVDRWIGGREEWAFTQFVREFDGGAVKEERLERCDPSLPGDRRWQLLSVNGQAPTTERRAEWSVRKLKKRLNPGKSLGDFFDFENATLTDETAQVVRYHLPLRNDHSWLFPLDRVNVQVTVNKATLAIDKIEARIDEPFRVALGLGQVMDLDFNVQMNPSARHGEADNPRAASPGGIATAVVNKFGERIEYAWSEFKRVSPHPDNVNSPAPKS